MPNPLDATAFVLFAAVLLAAAVCDAGWGKIPNRLTYPAVLAGLLFWSVAGWRHAGWSGMTDGLFRSAAATVLALVPFAAIFFVGGIGGGDAKLMGAVGALTARWECVLGTTLYAFLTVGVMGVAVMLRRRIVGRTVRRLLGAALTAAARVRPEFPPDSPRLPFGVAVCVGGLLAGAEHLLGVRMPWGRP